MPKVEWSFFLSAEDHKQLKWFMAYAQSRLTPWGQAVFSVSLFGLGISSVGTQVAAYYLPSFILALFITAYFLSYFFKPKIEARRVFSPTTAGGVFPYKIVVKNTGKHPIRNLSIHEQCLPYGLYAQLDHPEYRNHIAWLAPGEESSCTLVFRAPRRGIFELAPLLACSNFPSGVIRSVKKTGSKAKFIVYPKIIPPKDLPIDKQRIYQRGGISQSNKVGDSNEFVSTRDYRPGDRLRDIHWASSARTGNLIVKEYVEEYFVRVGFFIDTELKRFEKHKCFEARLSLCAGICRALNQRDYVIDIFLSEKTQHIQSGRGLNSFDQLLEFLAGVEGEDNVDFNQAINNLKPLAREFSELIVFLKDWDARRAEFINRLKNAGFNTRAIIIRDKRTTLPLPDGAAALYSSKDLWAND